MKTHLTIRNGKAKVGCPHCCHPKPITATICMDKGELTGKAIETLAADLNCPNCGPSTVLASELTDWNAKMERNDKKMAKKIAAHAFSAYCLDCMRMTAIEVTVGRYTEGKVRS